MAVVNEQLRITMKPGMYPVLKRLAALQQVPMARVVVDLIETAMPTFKELVVALEAVEQAKGKPVAKVLAAMTKLETALHSIGNEAVDQVDMFSGQVSRMKHRAKVKAKVKRRAKAK